MSSDDALAGVPVEPPRSPSQPCLLLAPLAPRSEGEGLFAPLRLSAPLAATPPRSPPPPPQPPGAEAEPPRTDAMEFPDAPHVGGLPVQEAGPDVGGGPSPPPSQQPAQAAAGLPPLAVPVLRPADDGKQWPSLIREIFDAVWACRTGA